MPANPIGMSPLNGLPIGSYKPVLVVKLDNTPNAQPHAGLMDADVVYIEEVEYGITRLAAVFSSQVPKRIGPVRSARITDIDLFAQYGRPAFGYSGAQRKMFPYLRAASIYDVSPYTGGGYTRDNARRIPTTSSTTGAWASSGLLRRRLPVTWASSSTSRCPTAVSTPRRRT